jgi:hypothetical protein
MGVLCLECAARDGLLVCRLLDEVFENGAYATQMVLMHAAELARPWRGVSCQTGSNLCTELRSSCSASVLSVIRLRVVCSSNSARRVIW